MQLKTCIRCNNEWTGKGSTCNTCKSRARRESQKEDTKGDPTPLEKVVRVTASTLTSSDQLFEDKTPNYFKYVDELFHKECRVCNKKFQTNLSLRKFCSPDCEERIWELIAGNGKILTKKHN